MDKQLLEALSNIGNALDMLVEALDKKQEAKSATATAMQGGDFGKQLETISAQVKSIKADTQQIIKNQQTIIGLSKQKESDKKTGEVEGASDPKKESAIKKGVGTILLIAVAVLAIGLAFKLVGKIDFLSVVGLALAITLIAIAFEKVASLNLGLKEAAIASLTIVMISAALTISSWLLSMITPISFVQALTGIMIGVMFGAVAIGLGKMLQAFAKIGVTNLLKTVIFLPLILPAIALGIALASYALQLVKPIGLSQFFGAVMVGLVFVVLAFGLKKIISAFKGIDPATAVVASFMIPILFTAMSIAIWASSNVLSLVVPISFMQFLVSIAISVVFLILSYVMAPILLSISQMKWGDVPKIPVFFTLISLAIMISSHILAMTADIGFGQLLKIVLFSIVLAIAVIAIGVTMFALSKLKVSVKDAIMGALLIVIISVAIMVSSHILALGNYDTYPDWKWALGVGLSLLAFTPAIVALGFIAISGIGALAILAGSGMILLVSAAIVASSHILAAGNYDKYPSVLWSLGVAAAMIPFTMGILTLGAVALTGLGLGYIAFLAGMSMVVDVAKTIVEVSHILAGGKYDNPGMLDWAIATTLLYAAFTPILLILGAVGLASAVMSFFGPNPWEMAREMIVQIAETIVDVSFVLQKGVYTGGPTKEWAEGIAIALGAFSPVYEMLMRNSILELFGGGGVGPDEFAEAILTVSDGIVTAAEKFSGASVAFKDGPPKEWAEGVGQAIGAFAPVYAALMSQETDFWGNTTGVTPEQMKQGIMTISEGIIDAAYFFAGNTAPFDEGNYPSEKWGKGVGAALGAFAPVFEALSKNQSSWFTSDEEVINGMRYGIVAISSSLVDSAMAMAGMTFNWKTGKWEKNESLADMWSSYPSESWAKGVGKAVSGFLDIFDLLNKKGFSVSLFKVLSNSLNSAIRSIASTAKILSLNSKYFDVTLDPNFVSNIRPNVIGFAELALELDKMLVSEKTITTEDSGVLGIGASSKTETIRQTKGMGIVDMVVGNLVRVAKKLFFNKKYFEDLDYINSFNKEVISTRTGILIKYHRLNKMLKIGSKLYGVFGESPATKTARSLVKMATILHGGKKAFSLNIDPNYMKNVGQNMLDFNELVKKLVESEGEGSSFLGRMGESISSLFGLDPISQIANRMVTLAKGYDAMATSLIKLGTAMKTLNISDAKQLGGLTKEISGVNISKTENENIAAPKKSMQMVAQTGGLSTQTKISPEKVVMLKKIDKMIELLTNIDKSSSSLNDFMQGNEDTSVKSTDIK